MTQIPPTMQAVVLDRITLGPDISLSTIPVPAIRPGWILVRIHAFGLNNSEKELRHKEIEQSWIHTPLVPGIECAGRVADASDSDLAPGTRVVACMGGMGRSFNGSYAQYAALPRKNVFKVPNTNSWTFEELGAFPETYLSAWGSLVECLHLGASDTLLIRGATCGLGYACIQLAKAMGAYVIGTTHREEKLQLLQEAGVDQAILDSGKLAGTIQATDKLLDLVGPSVVRDTLQCTHAGSIVCSTGILGGAGFLHNFDPIKDIPNGVYLTGYFSNFPTQSTFDSLFAFMQKHDLHPKLHSVYPFSDISKAITQQDQGSGGKIVVVCEQSEPFRTDA